MMKRHGPENEHLSIKEVCREIHALTERMMDFWKSAKGWAPVEAAGLLSRSMLEWQTSLAACLEMWLSSTTDGDLILAGANLGALVEGQLKLLLSVYYHDYAKDVEAIKRNGKLQDPDVLTLEPLREFFLKRVWRGDDHWDDWIRHVQQKRNAIHAFRSRDIGSFRAWHKDVRKHLAFVRYIHSRLPYP